MNIPGHLPLIPPLTELIVSYLPQASQITFAKHDPDCRKLVHHYYIEQIKLWINWMRSAVQNDPLGLTEVEDGIKDVLTEDISTLQQIIQDLQISCISYLNGKTITTNHPRPDFLKNIERLIQLTQHPTRQDVEEALDNEAYGLAQRLLYRMGIVTNNYQTLFSEVTGALISEGSIEKALKLEVHQTRAIIPGNEDLIDALCFWDFQGRHRAFREMTAQADEPRVKWWALKNKIASYLHQSDVQKALGVIEEITSVSEQYNAFDTILDDCLQKRDCTQILLYLQTPRNFLRGSNGDVYRRIVNLQFDLDNPTAAIETISKMIYWYRNDGFYRLSTYWLSKGNSVEAQKSIDRITDSEDWMYAQRNLFYYYQTQGNHEAALSLVNQLREVPDKNVEKWNSIQKHVVEYFLACGNSVEAFRCAYRIEDEACRIGVLIDIYLELEDPKNALKLYSGNESHFLKFIDYYLSKDLVDEALKLNRDNENGLLKDRAFGEIVTWYFNHNRIDEALELCSGELQPRKAHYFFSSLYNILKYPFLKENIEKILQMVQEFNYYDTKTGVDLVHFFISQNNLDEAIKIFLKMHEPRYKRTALIKILIAQSNLGGVLEVLYNITDKSIRKSDLGIVIQDLLATGRLSEALEILNHCKTVWNFYSEEAQLELVLYYLSVGDHASAQTTANQISSFEYRTMAYSETHLAMGNPDQAVNILDRLYPSLRQEGYIKIVDYYMSRNEYQKTFNLSLRLFGGFHPNLARKIFKKIREAAPHLFPSLKPLSRADQLKLLAERIWNVVIKKFRDLKKLIRTSLRLFLKNAKKYTIAACLGTTIIGGILAISNMNN